MMMIIAALLALVPGGPGQEKLFGDWAVVCDNVKRCEATAMMPPSWSGDQAPGLDLSREPGPAGAVVIALSPNAETYGIVDILIDGKLMSSGPIRDGAITLTGASAEGLARAMVSGKKLTLRAHRKALGTISLKGASAALRYIDAEQGRAGAVTALVARGKASAAAVPAARPVPRIQVVKPGKGKPATLTTAQTESLATHSNCVVNGGPAPEFYRLDGDTTLVIIPCLSGRWRALFVLTDGKIAPAPFDFGADNVAELVRGISVVHQPEWNPDRGRLDAGFSPPNLTSKCNNGIQQSWVWDGNRFRMIAYEGLDACRLSGNWLTRYRAEAVYR